MSRTAHQLRRAAGQTMVEYVALLALFVLVALAMVTLIGAFNNYGNRIVGLVGLDYP